MTVAAPAHWGRRIIETPEGVDIGVQLAPRSERLGALLLDLFFILLAMVLIWLAVWLLVGPARGDWFGALGLLGTFAIRMMYFPGFELRWHGRTPGKRIMGIRVIDRHGGPLRTDAVIARNLMREVEIFLPLSLLAAQSSADRAGWITASAAVWTLALTALPLFNRNALRAGDLIAGTWVIADPKPVLTADLAAERDWLDRGETYSFSRAQLDAYGIRELEGLARVLRVEAVDAQRLIEDVCARIQRKIGWQQPGAEPHPRRFLLAYYRALRGHLERKLLFGKRRLSKFDPL